MRQVRVLASQIGESVDGNREVRIYGTHNYHLAHFSQILGKLFTIRLNIFQQKFLMKFINNFLNQLPPIMFYAVGGVLVIQGHLSMGALVAALTAYKDLVAPWKSFWRTTSSIRMPRFATNRFWKTLIHRILFSRYRLSKTNRRASTATSA
ncbi:hypothetical protein [Aliamphritea spongicola]|nr:hypothetical protein [Aliamphritea spongicola]